MSELPYVAMCQLPSTIKHGTVSMLEGDIQGTYPYYHQISSGRRLCLDVKKEQQKVLFFLGGQCVVEQSGKKIRIAEYASLIPDPSESLEIIAENTTAVLEIAWDLTETDKMQLSLKRPEYPILQLYSECSLYTEPFKTERTISRTIVPHHILPRFSMGSNEAEENDRVEINNHPAIDQYFFSFPENDVTLLIEERKIHYKGNTLLHVPLGCNHGVEIGPGQKMHYIWIDFIVDEEAGLEYLDTVHMPLSERK